MKKKAGRPKSGKSGLTKEMIINTALKMVDESGIESFSMRKLASHLKVNPMAVYYHLKSKEAVLQELIKKAIDFTGFDISHRSQRSEPEWQGAIKNFAYYYLELFRAHRDLMLFLIINPSLGLESVNKGNEIIFSILKSGGVGPTNIIRITDIIIDYLNGYGLAESTGRIPDNDERVFQNQQWLETPDSDNYPITKEVFLAVEGDIATKFEVGLECIFAGIKGIKQQMPG